MSWLKDHKSAISQEKISKLQERLDTIQGNIDKLQKIDEPCESKEETSQKEAADKFCYGLFGDKSKPFVSWEKNTETAKLIDSLAI